MGSCEYTAVLIGNHSPHPNPLPGGEGTGPRCKVFAFTLIELLVTIAIIALLVGILLPALGASRKVARRMQCMTKMQSIGRAMAMYTSEHDELYPPSQHTFLTKDPIAWWDVQLGPYLGFPSFANDPLSVYSKPDQIHQIRSTRYRCPEDEREASAGPVFYPPNSYNSYGKNVYFELSPTASDPGEATMLDGKTWHMTTDIPLPSETVLFGEVGGGEFGVDHVMAHYWKLGRSTPGDGLDLDRHDGKTNTLYADSHGDVTTIDDTYNEENNKDQWNPATAR